MCYIFLIAYKLSTPASHQRAMQRLSGRGSQLKMSRLGCSSGPNGGRRHSTPRAISTTHSPQQQALPGSVRMLGGSSARRLLAAPRPVPQRQAGLLPRRQAACRPVAMVNVDVSPSVILGVGLIGAGVSLWQIRQARPWISKDYDVVVSCISLLVGGILIFQGWRLDPLLLFGQLMTTGAAVSFAIEALRLRSEVYEQEEKAALQDVFRRKAPRGPDSGGEGPSFTLPPPQQQQRGGWEGVYADDLAAARFNAAAQSQQAQPSGSYDGYYYDGDGAGEAPSSSGYQGEQYGGQQYVQADYYEPGSEGGYYEEGSQGGYYEDGGEEGGARGGDSSVAELTFPPGGGDGLDAEDWD